MKPDELSSKTEAELARAFQNMAIDTPADSGSRPSASHLYWRAQVLERLTTREVRDEIAARPARWGLVVALLSTSAGLVGAMASVESSPLTLLLATAFLPPAALAVGWWVWTWER